MSRKSTPPLEIDTQSMGDAVTVGHQCEACAMRSKGKLKPDWMMKLHRRKFLHLAAGAAALPALLRDAAALDYPARPVRIIVGFAAGGSADSCRSGSARKSSSRTRGTNIATEAVVNSPENHLGFGPKQ
jgi:hypothetical protein